MKRSLWIAALFGMAAITVLVAQKKPKRVFQNSAPAEKTVDSAVILQGEGNLWHTTPRQECRSLIRDSRGRLWTIGIESDGDEGRNATKQFIAMGRFEGVHWSAKTEITPPGFVYWPAAAPDANGGLWLAWSQFDEQSHNWRVRAAHFDGDRPGAAAWIGAGNGPGLRPAVIVEPDGKPLVIYESGEQHRFVLRAAKYDGARWQDEVVAAAGSNFRPFSALDRDGRTWLAWDRFTGGAYHVFLRSRKNDAWESEIAFFTGPQDCSVVCGVGGTRSSRRSRQR